MAHLAVHCRGKGSCKQRKDTTLLARRKLAHAAWRPRIAISTASCETVSAHACTESTIDHLSLPALIHLTSVRYSRRITARKKDVGRRQTLPFIFILCSSFNFKHPNLTQVRFLVVELSIRIRVLKSAQVLECAILLMIEDVPRRLW